MISSNSNDIIGNAVPGGGGSGGETQPVYILTDGATITPNWVNGDIQQVTLEGDRTIANTSGKMDGGIYMLLIKQDAIGSRSVTWGSEYKWQEGVPPLLSIDPNLTDIITFICDGTNLYGVIQEGF